MRNSFVHALVILIILFLYAGIDFFCLRRANDVAQNLKRASDGISRHRVQAAYNLQNELLNSNILSGVRILDSSRVVVGEFGQTLVGDFSFPEKDRVVAAHLPRFFSYSSSFLMSVNEETHLVVLFFYDEMAVVVFFSNAVLILFFWFFTFITIELKNKREKESSLKSIIRAAIINAHEQKPILYAANKLVQAVESDVKEDIERRVLMFKRRYRFALQKQNDLLSVERCEINRPTNIDLQVLTRDCLASYDFQLRELAISSSFKHKYSVFGDESKVFSIVTNLLGNALRAAQGFVAISTWDDGTSVYFRVTNDGQNLSGDKIKRLAQPNVSFSGSSGFGLYLSRIFTELHGGRLKISSIDGITQVTVSLAKGTALAALVTDAEMRRECEERQTERDSSLNDGSQGPFKIAVVDDEVWDQDDTTRFLIGENYEIHKFKHPDEFFMNLERNKIDFDIVFVDRFGPGFDTVEDRFAYQAKTAFKCRGAMVLYSNVALDSALSDSFDYVLSKDKNLTPLVVSRMIKRQEIVC